MADEPGTPQGPISISKLIADPTPLQDGQKQVEATPESPNAQPSGADHDWKKRYADSTREAQRLKAEADKYKAEAEQVKAEREKFKPYDELLAKPEFVEHVMEFVNAGYTKPPQPKQTQALSPKQYGMESFADFDLEEAYTNPNSPSGRMLSDRDQMIAGSIAAKIVDEKLRGFESAQKQRDLMTAEQRARQDYLTRHPDKTPEDIDRAVEWAKQNPLTVDRVMTYFDIEHGQDQLFSAGQQDVRKQMALSNALPRSMANVASEGGGAPQKSEADAFFDAIKAAAPVSIGRAVK